jgi:hypothetical protein
MKANTLWHSWITRCDILVSGGFESRSRLPAAFRLALWRSGGGRLALGEDLSGALALWQPLALLLRLGQTQQILVNLLMSAKRACGAMTYFLFPNLIHHYHMDLKFTIVRKLREERP